MFHPAKNTYKLYQTYLLTYLQKCHHIGKGQKTLKSYQTDFIKLTKVSSHWKSPKKTSKSYQTDFLKLTKVSSHWQNPNILQNDIRLTLSSQKCDQIEILCEALSWSGHNVLLEVLVELWWFSFTDLISFSISDLISIVGSSCQSLVVFIYWFDF